MSAPSPRPTRDLINEVDEEFPTTLTEAEENARVIAGRRPRGPHGLLIAEYDRRGAVEEAAAAYVMAGLCGNPDTSAELTALIAAVRTNRNFRG